MDVNLQNHTRRLELGEASGRFGAEGFGGNLDQIFSQSAGIHIDQFTFNNVDIVNSMSELIFIISELRK